MISAIREIKLDCTYMYCIPRIWFITLTAEAEAARGVGSVGERSPRAAGLPRQDGAHLIIWQALLASLPAIPISPRASGAS